MENIKITEISKKSLADLLVDADHGSTDRDICYNTETGEIADLHNTQQGGYWVVLIDLYNTTYDDVDTYTTDDWIFILNDQGVDNIKICQKNADGNWEEIELQIELI